MDQIKEFQDQYIEFTKITDFNLEERAKRVPAEKHFWVARLIEAKRKHQSLSKKRKSIKDSAIKQLLKNSPVDINNKKIMDGIDNSPELENINDEIREVEFLIEYLDLLVRQVTFIAQDIKNIIEIRKLEEQ